MAPSDYRERESKDVRPCDQQNIVEEVIFEPRLILLVFNMVKLVSEFMNLMQGIVSKVPGYILYSVGQYGFWEAERATKLWHIPLVPHIGTAISV